ncbi:SURF1 family protein [Ensifer adhaerens]|uniref:SURF1 family protein n=1 Tax=Ensifer adhaerens TaxID=106592 RepID=UPI00098FEA49|nr:SURF1 family protein [Ensifer adhaerens]
MTAGHDVKGEGARASSRARFLLTGALVFLGIVFVALGTWQVQRLFWKLDLIARVDARVHADAVPAPPRPDWQGITQGKDEYRRVSATGTFNHDKSVLVQAVTERGPGFWVLTPMRLENGTTVLVNRGFVPADRRDRVARANGEMPGRTGITGLLRISEPGGAFLRSNDPGGDRWFSRDVDAIATAKGLTDVAPYFIDADATLNAGGLPIGGLTVVRFRNSHLVYALTWFALAVMSAGGAWLVYRRRVA